MKIAPSLLAADLADLTPAITACERGGADRLHLDVMDGHFVPNLTFGLPMVSAVARRTSLPLDVHLMISNPDAMALEYVRSGAWQVVVHWEATLHLQRLLVALRSAGARAGVALNPATPVEWLRDILPDCDSILLMSVNPGFAGQAFLPQALERTRRLRRLIAESGATVEIGMDGGIGRSNIRAARAAGVDVAICGSSIFGHEDPAAEISYLRHLALSEPA